MTHSNSQPVSRRGWLAATAAVSAAGLVRGDDSIAATKGSTATDSTGSTGRLNQGVCMWCFQKFMSLEEMCVAAKKMGLVGLDLIDPKDFPTLQKHGLVCTMVPSHPLSDGYCDLQFHDMAIEKTVQAIEAAAAAKYRNVICFSGNARGIDPAMGMDNCVKALKELAPVAEEKGVTLQMELLNSRVNHPDYMCDNSAWGVELVKRVGSDRFRLLYDIYHMQIMEGDVIRHIEQNHEYYGHYHTAGNPGRHELDATQELNYPPIAKAIAETGFDGYFCHEFIPTGDPLQGLQDAVDLCRV